MTHVFVRRFVAVSVAICSVTYADQHLNGLDADLALRPHRYLMHQDPDVEVTVGVGRLWLAGEATTQLDLSLAFGVAPTPRLGLLLRGHVALGESITNALGVEVRRPIAARLWRGWLGVGPSLVEIALPREPNGPRPHALAAALDARLGIRIADHVFAAIEARTGYVLAADTEGARSLVELGLALGIAR